MKRKRFSTELIVAVLKQADLSLAVADLIRQIGISEQTFYRWKKQYGSLESDQVPEANREAATFPGHRPTQPGRDNHSGR